LLYQIISNSSVEVHNVRATNAPDLASFIIDMEREREREREREIACGFNLSVRAMEYVSFLCLVVPPVIRVPDVRIEEEGEQKECVDSREQAKRE
jgi:hypothetical protein